MIDNFVSSDTCSEIHTPHMPVPMRATSQHMEQQDVAVRPRLNYMDYIEKLTGMKVNELLEVSQDREAWRELVVACVDLQPPD